MMKRILLSLGSAGTLALGSLALAGSASASGEPANTMWQGGNNRSAYTASYSQRGADQQYGMNSRYDQMVADGQITNDQRTMLENKWQEMRSFWESLKDMSQDDRKAAMQQKRAELEAWAQDNGIPQQCLMGMHSSYGQQN